MSKHNIIFLITIGVLVTIFAFSGVLFAQEAETHVSNVIIYGKLGTGHNEFGMGDGDMEYPTSFAIDAERNIYILDCINNRIQKFDGQGNFIVAFPAKSYEDYSREELQKKVQDRYSSAKIRAYEIFCDGDNIYLWQHRYNLNNEEDSIVYLKYNGNGKFIEQLNTAEFNKLREKGKIEKDREQMLQEIKSKKKAKISGGYGEYDGHSVKDIMYDEKGNLYINSYRDGKVRKYDKDENLLGTIGEEGQFKTQWVSPYIIIKGEDIYQFLVNYEPKSIKVIKWVKSIQDKIFNWEVYKDEESKFEIKYPGDLIVVSKKDKKLLMTHSIPFEHPNPCNFSGFDSDVLKNLTDFNVSIEVVNKNLKETVSEKNNYLKSNFLLDNKLKIQKGFIDEFKIGSLKGYRVTSGGEGSGNYVYYFPLSKSSTLLVIRSFIPEFGYGVKQEYVNLPGVVLSVQEEKLFNEILSSFRVLK
jgi:hypothetical protein